MKKLIAFILTWMVLCITTAKAQTGQVKFDSTNTITISIEDVKTFISWAQKYYNYESYTTMKLPDVMVEFWNWKFSQTQSSKALQHKIQPAKTDSLKNKRP